MPVIYVVPYVLVFGVLIGIILAVCSALFINHRMEDSISKDIIITITSLICIILGFLLSNYFTFQVQFYYIATDYVQAAVDKKCGSGAVLVSEGNFFIADGFRWVSSDQKAHCLFGNINWMCSCSLK